VHPLLVLAMPLLALAIHDAVRRPSFRRLAVRNIVRRPAEAALVVVGSMLGTAIITAAFIVGDTFDASIRDIARTELGPIDQVVRVQDPAVVDAARVAVTSSPISGTDGVLEMTRAPAAARSVIGDAEVTAPSEPSTSLAEVDFDAGRSFGGDPATTGLVDAGPTPSGDQAVIDRSLADRLDLDPGDRVEVFAYGSSRTLVVRDVVPKVGLAGYQGLYVAPGTIAELASSPGATIAQPPTFELLVSNLGGVFDGADRSDGVMDELEARLEGTDGAEVQAVKSDLLDDAEATGESIGQLFTSIGAFSVLVGVLLLINLFVMLAEERKGELGMLRAVGLKRNHLMRSFGLEGAAYSIVAAGLGGLVGIGVGAAIVAVTRGIIAEGDWDLQFVFSAPGSSVWTGMLIGLVISMLAVWGTSARIARLNVIRAIRDLPEPSTDRVSARRLMLAAAGILVGLALTVAGLGGDAAVPALAGPPLALYASIPLLRPLVGRRASTLATAAAALVWSVAVFNVVPDAMANPGIEIFVVQGVVMVSAAVVMASQADRFWARIADRSGATPRGLAVRLALAYPLARTVRTGIQLAMFSLVVFTMTFLAVFSGIFSSQAPTIAADAGGGAQVFVDSNPGNPVTVADLESRPGVERAVPLLRGFPRYTARFQTEPTWWSMIGVDERLVELGPPALASWLPELGTEAEVWAAVLADPTLAVVPDFFLQSGGGPPSDRVRLGEEVVAIDPVSGDERSLTVAAINDSDWLFNGVIVSRDVAAEILGVRGIDHRHYVRVASGADAEAVARRLTAELVPNGGEATTFLTHMERQMAEQTGFFRLMQGYLTLGLLIGIAGLGVVMVRAVRERRRQVGMLRALGLTAPVVRRAFLLEATFVAAQGIAIGIGLGLLCSYQVLTRSATFGDQPLPFEVPWVALAVLLVVPLGAAMIATAAPAGQAARIQPAAALRIAE
jgi:putative ABC transport system permease protein